MGGKSSKEIFNGIVEELLSNDLDPNDHEYWDQMWKANLSIEEVFESLTADNVRDLITRHPHNLKLVFTQAVAQLYQMVETPYPVYFDQALNCVRILSRLLPIMTETDSTFVRKLLWKRQEIPVSEDQAAHGEALETKEGDAVSTGQGEGEQPAVQETEPLAVILINTLFHLLFLPDFTMEDPNTDFTEADIGTIEFKSALMWAPGVGSVEKSVVVSTQFDKNRLEILRLMVAAFSDSLYQSPENFDTCGSLWLEVATSVDAPYAEIVFYSLINTVLGYDPVGWGLPYGNLVATDTAKQLMEVAVQVLIILLDYGHPLQLPHIPEQQPGANIPPLTYVSPTDTDAQGFNVFRRILSTIEAPDQLNFIFRGFVRLLNNVHQSENSYLPYSVGRISIEQELLVLLWKCLEEIPKFVPYILKHCNITELVVPICYFMAEGRKDPTKVGMMYLCTFILLKLSGERSFGVALNQPYQLKLPIDIPVFSGNFTDLVVIVLHKMIVSGLDKLSALYNCFLTIICNVSPYCKSLCTISAVKLVNLFQLFTSPKFLYAQETNHVYVAMILETLNNIVQYQYEGNVNVVYAIVRRKELFEALASLTLPAAIKTAVANAEQKAAQNDKEPAEPKKASIKRTKSGHSQLEDEVETIVTESTPTDLIRTTSVERTVLASGDVQEVEKVSATLATSSEAGQEEDVAPDQQQTNGSKPAKGKAGGAALKFTPTQAWLDVVKAELPLNTIMRLNKHLVPQIDEFAKAHEGSIDDLQVMEFIRKTTLVGLLPVPHPIVIRKYQPNKFTCLWFTVFQWGVIFMHNQSLPLFDNKGIKLFLVQTM